MDINERDVQGFERVLKYLDENQTGAFGIKNLNKFQMMVLKYVGIGEGMEYESMEEYDLENLLRILKEESK